MAVERDIREILRQALPEMEILEAAEPAARGVADSFGLASSRGARAEVPQPGASLSDLRRKYLGTADLTASNLGVHEDVRDGEADNDDIVVTRLRARRSAADPADDPGPRTVIVSKKQGLVGSQG